jgi:hypothetical protein
MRMRMSGVMSAECARMCAHGMRMAREASEVAPR